MSEPWAQGEGIRNCGSGKTSPCLCLPHPYSLLPLFKPSSPTGVESVSSSHSSLLLPLLPDTVLGLSPAAPLAPSLSIPHIFPSHQDHTGLIWLLFPNTQFLFQTESPSAPLSHSGVTVCSAAATAGRILAPTARGQSLPEATVDRAACSPHPFLSVTA